MLDAIKTFLATTGIAQLFGEDNWWQYLVMYVIIGALFYLAIVKKFEPLLLMPIAFGMLLANLPGANLIHLDYFFDTFYIDVKDSAIVGELAYEMNLFLDTLKAIFGEGIYTITEDACTLNFQNLSAGEMSAVEIIFKETLGDFAKLNDGAIQIKMTTMIKQVVNYGGLLDFLYLGVKLGIYPCLIFIGIGAMTDFSPLISNPKSIFLGGAAQLGVFAAFAGALLLGFDAQEAASIGIIGGADGPTAINTTKELAPHLLGAIAIAAYSYMALIPLIQPPFMRLLTTKEERKIKMESLGTVSKLEKVLFPLLVLFIVAIILPDATVLVGCLMFGNLLNVCGVTDRLSQTAQNGLINVVTIFLGISVGATATAEAFLAWSTVKIIVLGLTAFVLATIGGLLGGKIMCKLTKGKINPLIGSAGVSAVPMAARVAQKVGQQEDPSNFLLMHAMGPNVAGVIGSAICAGVFLALFN